MTKAKHTLKLKRRREQKTDYHKRLNLLKSGKTRLVVHISNRFVLAQLVNYSRDGDETIASAHSKELEKLGFVGGKNLSTCYLTGYLLGKKGAKEELGEVILDSGLRTPIKGGKVFAVQKGAVDAGLNVLHSAEAFPSEERIAGKSVEEFATKLSDEDFKKRFTGYSGKNFDVKKMSELFENSKKEIDKKFSGAEK